VDQEHKVFLDFLDFRDYRVYRVHLDTQDLVEIREHRADLELLVRLVLKVQPV
jgi:hypothetical protein